ncbi:MAG: hypothetical protein ACTSR8_05610 [Promethearchaeota archaeon]
MSIKDPYSLFDLNDAERDLYKLIIQYCKESDSPKNNSFRLIKVTDLIKVCKYSKPKVYDIVKRLEEINLIKIERFHPMFIIPIDPEHSINKLIESKKKQLEQAGSEILTELNSLSKMKPEIPFSETPPLNFFIGIEEYLNLLEKVLNEAEKDIILICGYLIEQEDKILQYYIKEKLKKRIKLKILYGGTPKFKTYFKKHILSNISINNQEQKDIIETLFTPPIRITIVDDTELIMTLKKYQEEEIKIGVKNVSGIHSKNRGLIDYARDTYYMLKPTADAKIVETLIRMRAEETSK